MKTPLFVPWVPRWWMVAMIAVHAGFWQFHIYHQPDNPYQWVWIYLLLPVYPIHCRWPQTPEEWAQAGEW